MDINISRKLARDETTAPEVLARLAKTKDRIIRKNVASNPNTSLEILLELGAEFPRELL